MISFTVIIAETNRDSASYWKAEYMLGQDTDDRVYINIEIRIA